MGTMVSIYLPSESEGEIITWFSNEGNPTERTITLSGEGTPLVDASTYIEFPRGKNPVRSASIHLTNLEWENKYLTNPTLDVGVDGDIEWAFPGVMGHQTLYNDESPTRVICTGSSGGDTTTTIILPKNSDVTWATITLEGVPSGTIWKDDFETDKGWTLDTTGGWARGTPNEGTTSGTKALATYLTGNYPNNLAPTKWATSPTIDFGGCSGFDMNLKFQRRLGVEHSMWDDAYLRVYDGSNWVEVYHNGGTINEGSYSLQTYGVTAYASANPNFKIEFGLGPTDRSVVYTGWNIDDLEIELVDLSGQSPQRSALDVGNDGGTPEWSYVPKLESPQTTPDFSNKLDALVQSLSTSFEDEYGNEFVEIPLKISSDPNGLFKLTDMDISYSYTATVNKNPHNTTLFTELNELIPATSQGNFSVYLDVSSQTPGKIKISDVLIEYNEPPYLEKSIPSDKSIDEDGVNDQLIHLAEYFADDFSTPAQLIYTVESNSRPDKVYVTIYQSQYVRVASTIDNDWYGPVNITVSATDDKGMKGYSNEFTVTIDNVNDPPTEGTIQIPDISLQEGGTFTIDLDAHDYFVDIDSEVLYFEANVIDSGYTEYITLSVSEPGNLMMITSVSDWFGDDVPVRIYCDDAPITNIETIDVYQDILVNVVNVNDAPYWKSTWADVSHVTIEEDKENLNWINLQDYVNDVDTSISDLSFSIVGKSNACIGVAINEENWIDITTPVENYIGSTDVVFRVEDGNESGYAEASLTVTIKGRNDIPEVEIFTPPDGAKLSGKVKIRGSSYDVDSTKDIESVKVKIGNSVWLPATGTVSWEFEWDTTLMEDGAYTIEVVAQDRETTSEIKTVNVTVENVKLSGDEQYELDTDEDGIIDLLDAFPSDSSQWDDTDGDGYGDNQDGNNSDAFPYDPTQWEDKDGDGYGDNPKGNNPDEFPDDPNKHVSETAKKEREEKPISISTVLWIIVWVLIAINIITIIILITRIFLVKLKAESQ